MLTGAFRFVESEDYSQTDDEWESVTDSSFYIQVSHHRGTTTYCVNQVLTQGTRHHLETDNLAEAKRFAFRLEHDN